MPIVCLAWFITPQAVIVAPTSVLARQHYEKLKALVASMRAAMEQPQYAGLAAGSVGHALQQLGEVELFVGSVKVSPNARQHHDIIMVCRPRHNTWDP